MCACQRQLLPGSCSSEGGLCGRPGSILSFIVVDGLKLRPWESMLFPLWFFFFIDFATNVRRQRGHNPSLTFF